MHRARLGAAGRAVWKVGVSGGKVYQGGGPGVAGVWPEGVGVGGGGVD
jgi:hypothetical protein